MLGNAFTVTKHPLPGRGGGGVEVGLDDGWYAGLGTWYRHVDTVARAEAGAVSIASAAGDRGRPHRGNPETAQRRRQQIRNRPRLEIGRTSAGRILVHYSSPVARRRITSDSTM